MTSEIRTNSLTSRAGLSTVTFTDSGPMFSGITTFVDNSTFSVGTGGTIHAPATNTLNIGVNNTESLRIDSNSNLKVAGIVTATHFYGNGANLTGIPAQATIANNADNRVITGGSGVNLNGEANLTWNGTKFGVGTASPYTFGVATFNDSNGIVLEGSSQGRLLFRHTGGGTNLKMFDLASSDGVMKFRTIADNGTTVTERLRIDSSGRLLLGTTTEGNAGSDDLTIATSGSTGITVRSGTSSNGNLYFSDGTSGDDEYRGSIQYQHANNALVFATNAVERLRIDSSGRLLLGQTSAYGTNQMMIINGASHAGNAYNGQLMIQGSETNGSSTTGGRINFAGHDGNTARTWANITGAKENGTAGDTSAYLSFDTRPSGGNPTERLRIASDGTVSIGQAGYTQGGAAPLLSLYGSTGRAFKIMNSGSQTSGMQMQNSTTGYGEDAGIHFACLSGGSAYLVNQTNNVDFMVMYSKVSGSTKHIMQIYNDGKIGHQTNSDNLMLSNSQDGSGSNYFLRGSKNSTTPGGGNDCVWIYEDGDLRNNNNSYGQQSDIKLKENVVDAGSQWDDIKNLKVRKFNFKASTGFDTHTQIGLIAQEAELVSPGLVKEVKDRVKIEEVSEVDGSTSYKESLSETEKTKHVMYSVLYMKAIKALQEAMTRIETLEQDNIALRARVTNLEGN